MKRFLIFVFVIVGILVIADNIWSLVHYRKYYSGKKFTKEGWEAAGKEMSNINKPLSEIMYGLNDRCKMFDNLTNNYLKKGMKLKEVEKLLGKSISYNYCINKKIKCAPYSLGTCYVSSWTITPGVLTICFNKKNELIKFSRKQKMQKKLCNKKIIHCYHNEIKCICPFTKTRDDGTKGTTFPTCDFEVDRW
jgi:hypothetical protein